MHRNIASLASALVLLMLGGTALGAAPPPAAADSRFDDVLSRIHESFREPLSREALEERALKALVADLDPYGHVFDAAEWRDFNAGFGSAFAGVGVDVVQDEATGVLRIAYLLIDSAAAAAGASAGDWIEAIDGQPTAHRSLDDVLPRLRGEPGSVVRLTLRTGQAPSREVAVTRKIHALPSVHGWERDSAGRSLYRPARSGGAGYARVSRLAEESVAEMTSALDQLTRAGACGLVLDLRASGGGLMKAGIGIADLFLDRGLISGVETRGHIKRYDADAAMAWTGPMIVLIDGETASSSEFLAAALKDHGRARFMGQRTFGKGLVQDRFPLGADRGGLVLSTGRHVRPSGLAADRHDPEPDRQRAGVLPDEGLERVMEGDEREQWLAAMDLRGSPALVPAEQLASAGPDRILDEAMRLMGETCRCPAGASCAP